MFLNLNTENWNLYFNLEWIPLGFYPKSDSEIDPDMGFYQGNSLCLDKQMMDLALDWESDEDADLMKVSKINSIISCSNNL